LKSPRSLSPTSATRSECHHADSKMQQPTLSARAAGRHSTTVDHAARLPAQRGPWRSHGSHKQLCSPLHAARQHGLGPLVVGAFRPLPCLTRCEFADGSFNSVGPIVAAATLSVGPTAPDAVRGRQVVLRLHGHSQEGNPVHCSRYCKRRGDGARGDCDDVLCLW